MEAFLEQSAFIQSFSDDAKEGAKCVLIEEFSDTYYNYINATKPSITLLNKVIDMYLYLVVKLPDKLLDDVKNYLLKGITFNNINIYMHLPEYEQVVKLLRPEYYAEVNPQKFNQFTASKEIYKLALRKGYVMEDTYKNAYSMWYIHYLRNKSIPLIDNDINYIILHSTAECIKYLIDNNLVVKDSIDILMASNKTEAIIYFLKNTRDHIDIRKYLTAIDKSNTDLNKYLEPIMEMKNMCNDDIAVNKRTDLLYYLNIIYPNELDYILYRVIANQWDEGFYYIMSILKPKCNYISLSLYTGQVKYIKPLYYKLRTMYSFTEIINNSKISAPTFLALYDLDPVDLSGIILKYNMDFNLITALVSKGYKIKKRDIVTFIKEHVYHGIVEYMLSEYGKTEKAFAHAAIISDRQICFDVLRNKGLQWDEGYTKHAFNTKRYTLCAWLIKEGCPVDERYRVALRRYL